MKREIKTKGEKSSKRQPFLQKHVFFSVTMYCTIQYRMLPYTLKKKHKPFFFNLCKGKNRTILSHGFFGGKQVLYPLFATLAFYCSCSSVPVSQGGRVTIASDETSLVEFTGWGRERQNANLLIFVFSKHACCPYHVHS